MRKRVSEIVAAALLCERLALAGAAALAVAGLLNGPTAQAQEGGGEGEPELTERRKGRPAKRQDVCAVAGGVSGQTAALASPAAPLCEGDEPDCSPHPFDIMAIYALYQGIK